jgi:flagellar basal body-associated protein FliL
LRILFRSRRTMAAPVRVTLTIIAVLVGLAVVGALIRSPFFFGHRPADRSATVVNTVHYVELPNMTVALAGSAGGAVDVKVQLELEPSVDTLPVSDDVSTRLADRIADRMRDVEASAIRGTQGAMVVKSAVIGAATDEYGKGKIRAVLLESLVVH